MGLLGGLLGQRKAAPAASAEGGGVVKEGSLERFAQDVVETSMTKPVMVAFGAEWCGPCKALDPILERVVKQAKGKVDLVKIDVDREPALAQQLGVRSTPTVLVFLQGQPVTGFQGAQPESQIKALVEKLTGAMGDGGDDVEAALEAAKAALDQGELQAAAQIYSHVLQETPDEVRAIAGLARAMIAGDALDQAEQTLDAAPQDKREDAEIKGARAAIALAREAGALRPQAVLEAALAKNDADHAARAELATFLFLRGRVEEAIEQLLAIVKKDREWDEDGGRKRLLRLFEALGPSHPATLKGRRRLSSLLFS